MGKSVLIVHYSKEEWEFFRDLFDLRGDAATWAPNEVLVEDQFLKGSFDMILIEALLPKISGYDLCKRLKGYDKGKETPILLIGSLLQSFRVAHQVKTKYLADDIIVRPYDIEDMEKKFSFYLDGIRLDAPSARENVSRADDGTPLEDEEEAGPIDYSKVRIAIPFSGQLDQIPFPRVLAYFTFLGENGTLRLEGGQVNKEIVLMGGKPVSVTGALRGQSLGQMLLESGRITEDTFDEALETALDTGKRLGETLIEMNALSPHELYTIILQQAQEKIAEIFSWESGKYIFTLNIPDAEQEMPIDVNVVDLIVKGIVNFWDDNSVFEEFSDQENLAVFPVKDGYERVRRMTTLPKVARILDRVTGRTTLDQMLTDSTIERGESAKILLSLMMMEAIVLAPPLFEADKETRNFKKLGDRLILDATEEGEAFREKINSLYEWAKSRTDDDLFDLGTDDQQALQQQMENRISAVMGDKDRYRRADDLTKAKSDYIVNRLEKAFARLIGQDSEAIPISPAGSALLASEQVFREGLNAYKTKNFQRAKELFARARELDPYTAEYVAYFGYVSYLTSDPNDQQALETAISLLDDAIAINPNLDIPYLFKGRIRRDKGERPRAEALFERAYDNNPKSLEVLRELRKIFLERKVTKDQDKGKKPQEVMEFEHLINALYKKMPEMTFYDLLEADAETSHDDLRQNYFDLTARYRPNDAYEQLSEVSQERADEIFQRLTDAYSTLIDTNARNEYNETLNAPNQLTEEQSAEMDIPQELIEEGEKIFRAGRKLMAQKEYKNASLQFRKAFETNPTQARYAANMAYAIYRAFKNSQESQAAVIKAKEMIRQLLGRNPNCGECYVMLGRIYLEEGKRLLAEEQVENALRLTPDNVDALRLFSRLYSRHKGKSKAKYLQRESAKLEQLRQEMAKTLKQLKRIDYFKALDLPRGIDAERVEHSYRKKVDVYESNELAADFPEDMKMLQEDILEIYRKAFKTLVDPMAQQEYIGKLDEKSIDERFNIEDVEDHRELFKKAQVMIKEGMFDRALQAMNKASDQAPTHVQYQIWRGFILFRADPDDLRVRDQAKEIIDEALDLDETNADAYWMLGKIYQFEGDDGTATKLYKKALECDPKHREATMALQLREQREEKRREVRTRHVSIVDSIKKLFSKKK